MSSLGASIRDVSSLSAEYKPPRPFTYGDGIHDASVMVHAHPLALFLTIDVAQALVEALQRALRDAAQAEAEATA